MKPSEAIRRLVAASEAQLEMIAKQNALLEKATKRIAVLEIAGIELAAKLDAVKAALDQDDIAEALSVLDEGEEAAPLVN